MRRGTLFGRAPFSARLAAILIVLGAVIAATAVAIPLAATSEQTRQAALDRAADRGALATDLLAAEGGSLTAFARGVAAQVPLDGDIPAFLDAVSRGTAPGDVVALTDGSGGVILRRAGADPGSAGSMLLVAAATASRAEAVVRPDRDGTPWLIAAATVPASNGRVAVIARPLAASAVERLAGGGGAAASGLVVVAGNRVVLPGSLAGRSVAAGATLPDAYGDVARTDGPSTVVHADGGDVAAVSSPVAGGAVRLISTAAVGGGTSVLSSVAAPVVVVSTVFILLGLLAVFLLVQRSLQRPLRRLDRAVAAMAGDNFAVPVAGGSDDEVARLAASFEVMRLELRAVLEGAEARAWIATELSAVTPLAVALDGVVERLAMTTGAHGVVALLLGDDEEIGSVHVVGVEPPRRGINPLLTGDGLLAAVARMPGLGPVVACALPGSPENALGLSEICAAPLRVGTRRVGIIAIADAPTPFNRHDTELLAVVAEQVALAVERERVLEAARVQANTDGLTGLHNRRFLTAYLEQQMAMADRGATATTLLMLDVDNFKSVNDTHGHEVGDAALRTIAGILVGRLRRSDVAARLGGDEFVVVMAETDKNDAVAVAETLRTAVAASAVDGVGGSRVPLSVSIGVATRPPGGPGVDRLLTLADGALYGAKRAGRNRVRVAVPEPGSAPVASGAAPRTPTRRRTRGSRPTGKA